MFRDWLRVVLALAMGASTSCAHTSHDRARSVGAYGAEGQEDSWSRALRRRVLSRWDPFDVAYKTSFQSAAPPRPTTVLAMRVEIDGSVSNLVVARSSGFPALDEQAIAAVRAATPLPPPPVSLRDSSGGVPFELGLRVYRKGDRANPAEDEKLDPFPVIYAAPRRGPGTLFKDEINVVMAFHDHEMRACYGKEKDAPEGNLVLRFIVQIDGSVSDGAILKSKGLPRSLEDCLLAALTTWRFPRPVGGSIDVNCPLVFPPNDGP